MNFQHHDFNKTTLLYTGISYLQHLYHITKDQNNGC